MKLEIKKEKQKEFTELMLGAAQLADQEMTLKFEEGVLKVQHLAPGMIYGVQLEFKADMFDHLPQDIVWIVKTEYLIKALKAFKNNYTFEEQKSKLLIVKDRQTYTLALMEPMYMSRPKKDFKEFKTHHATIEWTKELEEHTLIAASDKDESVKYSLEDTHLTIRTNKYSSIHTIDTHGVHESMFSTDVLRTVFKAYPNLFSTFYLGTNSPVLLNNTTDDYELIVALAPRVDVD